MRDWLIHWLLLSRLPCVFGIHIPILGGEIVDGELVDDEFWECGACDKRLHRAIGPRV